MAQQFWSEFGLLIHSILSKPMDGAALVCEGWDDMMKTWARRAGEVIPGLDLGCVGGVEVRKKGLIKVGIWCFKMAMRGDGKSTLSFLYLNYLARFHAKLGSNSEV
jgi:hypothetical protein